MAAALEGRVRLLVIDNCEHVLDAAADLVEAILAHSATVKVLATSREGRDGTAPAWALALHDVPIIHVPSLAELETREQAAEAVDMAPVATS